VTENPDEADYALVFIASPIGHGGYDADDVKQAATATCRYHYNMANTLPKPPAKPALPVATRWRNLPTAATKANRKHQPT
jgi:hypothetical protein